LSIQVFNSELELNKLMTFERERERQTDRQTDIEEAHREIYRLTDIQKVCDIVRVRERVILTCQSHVERL
jgi:hypothetical protein